MVRLFFALGSVSGLLGVAAGAFGAHGLRDRLSPESLAIYETAVRYHLIHALALLAAAWAVDRFGGTASAAGWLFLAGTLVFSGSLYGLSLSGLRWLGAITPLGGAALIAGWACLAWAAISGGT